MTDAIYHRGPDGEGHFIAQSLSGHHVALGHRRLSIIDLGGGDQPMHLDDQQFSIVFNGEIYNYIELRSELKMLGCRFKTDSDTEVILHAWKTWGSDCLSRLRGMFAFALWDKSKELLFLARDPFGKKPLFYKVLRGEIIFASELAALLPHPSFDASISYKALSHFLLWKYVPGPKTLIQDLNEIPAGHYGVWSNGQLALNRYYHIPNPSPKGETLPMNTDTVAAFRAELVDAITIRLRSDVPLGAFLSGGIDSSAIVALMSQISGKQVKTFSVGFHEEEYSELWAARLIAKRYKTDHHEIKISPDDFLADLEAVTWQRGAPLSEMADLPVFALSKLAAQSVKVVLSGEGADELLAGYPKHMGELYVTKAHRMIHSGLDRFVGDLGRQLPYKYRRLSVLARAAQERDFITRQAAWFGLMDLHSATRLCPSLYNNYEPFYWDTDPGEASGAIGRSLKFDKAVWLPGTLLERGDRMTMAASLEGRMPFMDTQLTKFVSKLPSKAFIAQRRGKAILRQAVAQDIPSEILTKPKAGFRVPIHQWFRGKLRDYSHEHFFGSQSQLSTFVDQRELQKMWVNHQEGRKNHEKELWALMCLEIFLKQLSDRTPHARKAA